MYGGCLQLRVTDCKDHGIHVDTQKAGKAVIYAGTRDETTAEKDTG